MHSGVPKEAADPTAVSESSWKAGQVPEDKRMIMCFGKKEKKENPKNWFVTVCMVV